MATSPHDVTQLLIAWGNGEQEAIDKLMPLVYGELRRMAKRYAGRQSPRATLQTSDLIHEAYLRMVGQHEKHWQNRAHFYGVAATVMRHILVDYARARHAGKRGGNMQQVELDEALGVTDERSAELIALNDALNELAAVDERKSRVVELRYFGGFSVEETAEVLKVSPVTVMRDWNLAKVWLYRQLRKSHCDNQ